MPTKKTKKPAKPKTQPIGAVEESLAAIPDAVLPEPVSPPVLTPALAADSLTLSLTGAEQMTAQLLGTPESAPWLAKVAAAAKRLSNLVKLLKGDDAKGIEGLKKLVIEQGEPWAGPGSRQMVLAGTTIQVKAVNYRPVGEPPTIDQLDEKKVEAFLRGIAPEPEAALRCYMRQVTRYTLKDLPPQQEANLKKLLADTGPYGQGIRECFKDMSYSMLTPEEGE